VVSEYHRRHLDNHSNQHRCLSWAQHVSFWGVAVAPVQTAPSPLSVKQNNFSDTQYNIQILDIFCIHRTALHRLAMFQNTLCTTLPSSPNVPDDNPGSWLIQHIVSSFWMQFF
jgi:hypothetical protein